MNLWLLKRYAARITTDHLPAREEFFSGGPVSGQAYNEATMAGDRGIAVAGELSHAIPLFQHASSPVPFSYNQLLQRTTFVFLLALPLGFAGLLNGAGILAELLISYVFLGLDVLGGELEEPFGEAPNNLPIAAMAKIVEIELRAALGETDLPAMPVPVDFVLM